MKTKLLHIMILLLLITGAMTPMPAQAKAAKPAVASEGISPAGMLKVDGTLSLDGNFNGKSPCNAPFWIFRLDEKLMCVIGDAICLDRYPF